MELGYLLNPAFQYENRNGKPLVGGFLKVFEHGTTIPYITWKNFDGDRNPAEIPLNDLGMAVVLAEPGKLYDIFCYDIERVEQWSRVNVGTYGGAGGASGASGDGFGAIRCTGASRLTTDGNFQYSVQEVNGDSLEVLAGILRADTGWYHYDATVRLIWESAPANRETQVKLAAYLNDDLASDVSSFDMGYSHDETVRVSGEVKVTADDTVFNITVTGMPAGMEAQLVDFGMHTVSSQGGSGEKNIHRLLRWYTGASEADLQHPAGDWLHDLDAVDGSDPSGHPMVTAEQLFGWYEAGQVFDLYEIDSRDGRLGWSAVYRMVAWEDQSDWWSQGATEPGKAVRIEFFRMGVSSTPYRGGLIAYIRYRGEDYMRLYPITPGQSVWVAEYQEKLTPGTNITIEGNVISSSAAPQEQADWTETDTSAVSFVKHKPTVKPVEAGNNITITEGSDSFVISSAGASEAQVAALAEQVAALAETVSRLTDGVNRMQGQVSHWAYEINTTQSQVSSLQSTMNQLNAQYLDHGIAYDSSSHSLSHQL